MTQRLTYNSTNIDGIVLGPAGINPRLVQEGNHNRAGSGKVETISQYGVWHLSFNGFFSQDTYHSLLAWYSWARQGKTFSFALDSGNVSNTTLDDAAAAAQKVIPLTATTGLSAGDFCLVKSDDDDEFEVIEIDSVSAGVSVTAVNNLNFTYASADIFRHLNYYPSLIHTAGSFEPRRYGVMSTTSTHYYQYLFEFEESP